MAQELAIRVAGVEEHSAPPQRKGGVLVRRGAFAVKREVFSVATMSAPARRLLRERLDSELAAVRDAIRKAELVSSGSGAPAAPAGKDGRLSAAGAAAAAEAEEGGGWEAKKRKAPPFAAEQGAAKAKRVKAGDRERLAGRLASLPAALPDHAVAYLQSRRVRVADSRRDGLFHLKMLLDKFAPARTPKRHGRAAPPEITPESRSHRRAPLVGGSGSICLSRNQGAGGNGNIATVQEEEKEEEEGVDICGGVSRIAIRDIADKYGELVEGVGVKLLSPLQRKYVDLAEQGEYVDICGDASPVVFLPGKGKGKAAAGDGSTSLSLSSSDGSDSSSSDSDSSSSSSDSESESDPGKIVGSRPPPPEPAPEAVHAEEKIAEPAVQDQCAPPVPTVFRINRSPPVPAILPPKVNGTNAQPPEPVPELKDQCAPPAPTAHPVTSSSQGEPAAPPKENHTDTQPPEPAPDKAVQCVPQAPTGPRITGSAPPPAGFPQGNGASSQPPALAAAPVVAAAAVPIAATNDVSGLLTAAKEEAERRRQLAKQLAKTKARLALLEVERAALPDERVHRRDMEQLGLAAFEHVTSTVKQQGARAPPAVKVNGGAIDIRVSPGKPSVLQQLGVFLKADDFSDDDEEYHRQAAAFASHGEDMEVEDGEIRT